MGYRSGAVNVFKGIPYARAPVGDLRFCPPQPPEPWHDPRDATRFGAAPIQSARPLIGAIGPTSEDCLTLNVWAPATAGPHPVLVWIHGGQNISGASSQPLYDGVGFAEKGLVFVSVNYRLGAFGFLELGPVLPSLAGSGLNGLRDLVAALGWVRDNIEEFGGDPGAVSVMGESAGGKNLCALMAIPAALGLFRRAAVQSGGGHTVYESMEQAAPVARAFLQATGLEPGAAAELRRLPVGALLKAQETLLTRSERAFPFRPTVDGSFLPTRPIDAVCAGAATEIELIIGTCRDEAALVLSPAQAEHPFESRQLAHLDLPQMQTMEARYAAHFPNLTTADRRIRVLTAEEYWIPCVEFAEAHAAAGGATRMYRFDHATGVGPLEGYVPHVSDLPFIFDNVVATGLSLSFAPGDAVLRRRLHAMWAGWAIGGGDDLGDMPPWPRYDAGDRQTLLLDRRCQLSADPAGDERVLWAGML